jgi:hypothetical protein
MGLFDFRKRNKVQPQEKEIKYKPNNEYFLDILSDDRILISSDTDDKALNAYYNTPQLASIINYSSEVMARNDLRFYNDNGEQQENELLQVFENPHPLYSEGEFWETYFKQFELYNIVLTYKVSGGVSVSGLFILPFNLIQIVPVKGLTPLKIFLAKDIKEIIDYYKLSYNNKTYKIPVEDVWMMSGTSLRFDEDGYLTPDSKIDVLAYPIANIQANYEARYSLVNNRGALGLWVNKSSNDFGSPVPIVEEEKESIYKTFRRRFGLNKGKEIVGITDANMKFESSSIPVKDMEFNQGIQQDKITIADAYTFPILLLNELEGSTYNNLGVSDINLYTKKVIPMWEKLAKSITREFLETGYFEFYTGDIEALKKDDKVEAETNTINTQLIIELNTAITNRVMTPDEAIQTLVLIADVPEEVAKEVIRKNIPVADPEKSKVFIRSNGEKDIIYEKL